MGTQTRLAELTPQVLARLAGGTIRISNEVEDYVFEGTIASAKLDGETLRVTPSEMHRVSGAGGVDDAGDYATSLDMFTIQVDGNVVTLRSSITHEHTVLCAPDTAPGLNDSVLAAWVGGDIEVQRDGGFLGGGTVFRGPLISATVVDDIVVFVCEWLGELKGNASWRLSTRREFRRPVSALTIQGEDSAGRFLIMDRGEPMVLFGPRGKKFDRAKVADGQ